MNKGRKNMDVNAATLLEIANLLASAHEIDMQIVIKLTPDIDTHNIALKGNLRNQWFKLLEYANNRETNRVYELVKNACSQDPGHKNLGMALKKVQDIFDGKQRQNPVSPKQEKSVAKAKTMGEWRRLTLPEINDLSRDLVKNHVPLACANQALEDIGVFAAVIQQGNALPYHYINIIKHLEPRGLLSQWLQKLAQDPLDPEGYGYVFVREWLNLLAEANKDEKKIKANYIREKLWYPKTDILKSVDWLHNGYKSVQCVVRLRGQNDGTGFLITNDLLVTNWHIIANKDEANAAIVEFDYFRNEQGSIVPHVTTLDPDDMIFTYLDEDDEIDVAIIALSEPQLNRHVPKIREYVTKNTPVYILQHRQANEMEITLNNNQIQEIRPNSLRYMAPTDHGSSGSPVFDADWNIVGVHWGSPQRERTNIGTRISKVMSILKNSDDQNAKKIYEKILAHQK